jgi:hypothetical protein
MHGVGFPKWETLGANTDKQRDVSSLESLQRLENTFGTRLGEAGADAFTIMKLMGHSTITMSQRYVHPVPETMERAIERMETLRGLGPIGTEPVTALERRWKSPQLSPQRGSVQALQSTK